MNNVGIKAELVAYMNKYFDILNRLLLHAKHKLLIILKYTCRKLRLRFSLITQK